MYIFCSIIWASVSPVDCTSFHLNIRSCVEEESVSLSFQEAFSIAWAFIVYSSLKCGTFVKVNFYLVKVNPVHFVNGVSSYEDAVFTCTFDVLEVDAAYFSTGTFHRSFWKTPSGIFMITYSTWIRSYVNRLTIRQKRSGSLQSYLRI